MATPATPATPATATAAPTESGLQKFEHGALTLLQKLGHDCALGFKEGTKVAQLAAPAVDMFLPGIAALYNSTLQAVVQAEATATAAGAGVGSGPQKLQQVIGIITPVATQVLSAAGAPVNADSVNSFVTKMTNDVVALLNAFQVKSA